MSRVIILHHDDWDGIVSAWIVRKYWPHDHDEWIVRPVNYGAPLPDDVTGFDEVFVLDFSYPADELNELAKANGKLVVIDHHKTAVERLSAWDMPPNVTAVLKCESADGTQVAACELAWEHVWLEHGCDPAECPLIVQYVADRDVWRFALPHSKVVSIYMQTIDRDINVCEGLHNEFDMGQRIDGSNSAVREMASMGHAIQAYQQQCVKQAVAKAVPFHLPLIVNGAYKSSHVGLLTNMPVGSLISDTAGMLATMHVNSDGVDRKADFGCCWFYDDPNFVYSLRSRGDFDVAALAKGLGGGGHPNAAGFTIDHAPWQKWPIAQMAKRAKD